MTKILWLSLFCLVACSPPVPVPASLREDPVAARRAAFVQEWRDRRALGFCYSDPMTSARICVRY